LPGDLIETAGECELVRPRHQQAKRDGLGVAVGEAIICRIREKQFAPFPGKFGQCRLIRGELLGDFEAEQLAKPGGGVCELLGIAWRGRVLAEKILEHRLKFERKLEIGARRANITVDANDVALQFTVTPERPFVAVGLDEIRQGLELFPLLGVVSFIVPRVKL
jgi:hypothetical protein